MSNTYNEELLRIAVWELCFGTMSEESAKNRIEYLLSIGTQFTRNEEESTYGNNRGRP